MKDLIVDMEPFMDSYKKVMPYLINDKDPGDRERLQSQEDVEKFEDTTKCILCAACTTSCPVFWTADSYIGPAAIVNAHRFVFDSRDEGSKQRLEILKDVNGAFRCRTAFNCTSACPKGIQVTKNKYVQLQAFFGKLILMFFSAVFLNYSNYKFIFNNENYSPFRPSYLYR